jgi:hypothetical protein
MSYRIEQEQTYLGHHRWRWGTWIDAPDPQLDGIAKVTWRLHHTFPQPVVETTDRPRRFKIVLTGWGVFQIRAELELVDGGREQLSHWLQLSYPNEVSAPPRGVPSKEAPPESQGRAPQGPRVFLSYGSEDARLADRVKAAMREHGFDVRDAAEIAPGEPFKAAVQKMIRESDLVLGLVTSEFASPHVIAELNAAEQSAKPTVAAVGLEVREVFGLNKGLKRIGLNLAAPGSETELAERLIKER